MKQTYFERVLVLLIIPTLIGCGGGGGGLPDLGLSNVKVDAGSARAAVITSDGGTITATGANGVVYKLDVPANAVLQPTNIAMYPIKSIKNLPGSGTVSGGVNFAPDGLELLAPATLTIQLPTGIDPKMQFAIAYNGDADKLHLGLGTVSGQTITVMIHHFSGTALAGRQIADLVAQSFPFAQDSISFEHRMADAFRNSQLSNISPRPDYLLILRNWYDLIVKPALIRAGDVFSTDQEIAKGVQEYSIWLDAILYAKLTLGDQAFDVQPENVESETLAVATLRRWYRFYNDLCATNKANPVNTGFFDNPLVDAALALEAGNIADTWHIVRRPNSDPFGFWPTVPDYESLLNNLCVKVVIESKRILLGNNPGDEVIVGLKAGVKIADGAIRHDIPLRVKFTRNGSTLDQRTTDATGQTLGDFTWPQGANPLVVGILAKVRGFNATDAAVLGQIAVFDQISKTASNNGGGNIPNGSWQKDDHAWKFGSSPELQKRGIRFEISESTGGSARIKAFQPCLGNPPDPHCIPLFDFQVTSTGGTGFTGSKAIPLGDTTLFFAGWTMSAEGSVLQDGSLSIRWGGSITGGGDTVTGSPSPDVIPAR